MLLNRWLCHLDTGVGHKNHYWQKKRNSSEYGSGSAPTHWQVHNQDPKTLCPRAWAEYIIITFTWNSGTQCSLLRLACQMLSCTVFEPLNRVTWSQTIEHWVTSVKSMDFRFETVQKLSLVMGMHWRHSSIYLITRRRMCLYFLQYEHESKEDIFFKKAEWFHEKKNHMIHARNV